MRGSLLLVSIVSMFAIGIALKGKIYLPNTGDLLDILNFAGDLGNGLLYGLARAFWIWEQRACRLRWPTMGRSLLWWRGC